MAKGSYTGFLKLSRELDKEKGVRDPRALAAAIGNRKYGKAAMQKHAAAGKTFRPKS